MPGLLKDTWWSQKRDLYTLLVKFNESKASDERDMIYALLGISEDMGGNDSLRADYIKSITQVIQNASLFLFGQTNTYYSIMQEFLSNFTLLNIKYLSRVAKSGDMRNVADVLERQGGEVKITEDVLRAAAENLKNGKEVMALLLEQRGSEVDITEGVVEALAWNWGNGEEVMALLLQQRIDGFQITPGLIAELAESFSADCIALLLKQRGSEVEITEGVKTAATRNLKSGKEVMALLERHERGL
jgi:hypothetical protein